MPMSAHPRLLLKSLEPLQGGKDLRMRQEDMEMENSKSSAPVWRRKHSAVAGQKDLPSHHHCMNKGLCSGLHR